MKKPLEKIAVFGSLFSFIVFVFLLKQSGVSVGSIVNIQNSFLRSFLGGSGAFDFIIQTFLSAIVAVLLLVLSLAFLSSYGYFEANKKLGMIVGIIEAAILLVFFPSLAGIFIALSLLLISPYIILLANTYGKELKRWINFRVGSNSIGKVFLIFNLFVALAVFLAVYANASFYQQSFREQLTELISQSVENEVQSGVGGFVTEDAIQQQAEQVVQSSPIFAAYFRWLPVLSALSVWVILEFLRNLLLSNVGGIFTSVLIKFFRRFEK
jgi:hypothetical protein